MKDKIFLCIILFYTGILNLVVCFNKNIKTLGMLNINTGFRIVSCIIGICMIAISILFMIFKPKKDYL